MLDAVDFAFARNSGFAEPARIASASGRDLFITYSSHHNSNQAYLTTLLLSAHGDKLHKIGVIDTFSESSCAAEETQTPAVKFDQGEDGAGPIVVTVTIETLPGKDGCEGVPKMKSARRVVTAIYRRDAATNSSVVDSDALERLAKANEGRL